MTNRIQEQGAAAYRLGWAYFENPYGAGPKRAAWAVGWSLAWCCDPEREKGRGEDEAHPITKNSYRFRGSGGD